MAALGWTVGRNVKIDYRWGSGDADRIRKLAAELVELAPDVILSAGSPSVAALQQHALASGGPLPADLKRLHKYMREVEHIGVSDEMGEVVEELLPELAHKLPPKRSRS